MGLGLTGNKRTVCVCLCMAGWVVQRIDRENNESICRRKGWEGEEEEVRRTWKRALKRDEGVREGDGRRGRRCGVTGRLQCVEVKRGDDGEMSRRREGRTSEGKEAVVNPFAELRCFGATVMSVKQQTIWFLNCFERPDGVRERDWHSVFLLLHRSPGTERRRDGCSLSTHLSLRLGWRTFQGKV